MKPPGCARCDSGWFQHPTQGWAVACPNCRPAADIDVFWLPGHAGNSEGTVVRRYQLPAGHPSQQLVEMPDYARAALAQHKARQTARTAVLESDTRRSA
jgi:hypothetical protein